MLSSRHATSVSSPRSLPTSSPSSSSSSSFPQAHWIYGDTLFCQKNLGRREKRGEMKRGGRASILRRLHVCPWLPACPFSSPLSQMNSKFLLSTTGLSRGGDWTIVIKRGWRRWGRGEWSLLQRERVDEEEAVRQIGWICKSILSLSLSSSISCCWESNMHILHKI